LLQHRGREIIRWGVKRTLVSRRPISTGVSKSLEKPSGVPDAGTTHRQGLRNLVHRHRYLGQKQISEYPPHAGSQIPRGQQRCDVVDESVLVGLQRKCGYIYCPVIYMHDIVDIACFEL
jgi:hypothetical protein